METGGYEESDLDALFAALADPTRRAMLARLARGEASVGELARPFAISQPAISRHLKVLERAGLITRGRAAQRRPAKLNAGPMRAAVAWLEEFRGFWAGNLDQLEDMLEAMKNNQLKGETDD